MNISKATAQGRRPYQEDRFVVSTQKDGKLIAIMDGHGGDSCASRVAKTLPQLWAKHMAADGSYYLQTIDLVFKDLNTLTSNYHDGCTTSLVFIPTNPEEIYVAILGDSPVIVLDSDGKVNISPMHNARSNAAEREAAQERGALYSGGYIYSGFSGSGLQMTRVLGDHELGRILNRVPEVYTVKVNPNSFVLVGSDGLFDPSNLKAETEIAAVVERVQAGDSAQALVDRALAVPTGDNVTAVLIRVGNKKSRRAKKVAA